MKLKPKDSALVFWERSQFFLLVFKTKSGIGKSGLGIAKTQKALL